MMIRLVEYFVLKNTGHKSPPKYKFKKNNRIKYYVCDSNLKMQGEKPSELQM